MNLLSCVWCFISVCPRPCLVASPSLFHLCWTNPLYCTSQFPDWNPACLLLKSLCFVCYMPFWCLCCSSMEVNRCDSRVKGECIILVCCQVCCGQVFLKLNCSSVSLWRGMLVMRWLYLLQTDLQQGLSDLFFGWFPVRLVIIVTGARVKVPTLRLSDLKSPAVKLHVQMCV